MPASIWDDHYYLTAYLHAKEGLTDSQIAQKLGVTKDQFHHWQTNRPALQQALHLARQHHDDPTHDFTSYVHAQLPPDLQELWEKLQIAADSASPSQRLHAITHRTDDATRQYLLLHATILTNFNLNAALTRSGVSKKDLDRWHRDCPAFAELLDHALFYKKNFVEGAALQKVAEGDTAAILQINKTLNKDRGYGDSREVTKHGSIDHKHTHEVKVLRVSELDLDQETSEKLAEAVMRRRLLQSAPTPVEVIDHVPTPGKDEDVVG